MTNRETLESLRDKVEVYVELNEKIDAHHNGRAPQSKEILARLLEARDRARDEYRKAFEDSIRFS